MNKATVEFSNPLSALAQKKKNAKAKQEKLAKAAERAKAFGTIEGACMKKTKPVIKQHSTMQAAVMNSSRKKALALQTANMNMLKAGKNSKINTAALLGRRSAKVENRAILSIETVKAAQLPLMAKASVLIKNTAEDIVKEKEKGKEKEKETDTSTEQSNIDINEIKKATDAAAWNMEEAVNEEETLNEKPEEMAKRDGQKDAQEKEEEDVEIDSKNKTDHNRKAIPQEKVDHTVVEIVSSVAIEVPRHELERKSSCVNIQRQVSELVQMFELIQHKNRARQGYSSNSKV